MSVKTFDNHELETQGLVPTKILVPTDFSEYSDRALGEALDIAKQYMAKVFLLHVEHEGIHPLSSGILPDELVQKMTNVVETEIKTSLQNQLNLFPQAKEVEVVTNLRQGIPCEEILKEAKGQGINLIVIASLGQSGIAKYLIGSVARNVLKDSECPVLLSK